MKNKTDSKKHLRLNTEAVRVLQSNELSAIQGGADQGAPGSNRYPSREVNCLNGD